MKKDFSMKRFDELPVSESVGQSALHVIGSAIDAEYLAMSMAVMKPGEKILKHTHDKAEEVYVLMEGRSTIRAGNKTIHAEALTFFRFPAKTPREIINDSKKDAKWIFIGAPIDEYLSESAYPISGRKKEMQISSPRTASRNTSRSPKTPISSDISALRPRSGFTRVVLPAMKGPGCS